MSAVLHSIDTVGGVAGLRAVLQTGDVLLYVPNGLFGKAISMKTWSRFSHCELYVGEHAIAWLVGRGKISDRRLQPDGRAHDALGLPIETWASRDPKRWFPMPSGGGVNFYALRTAQLAAIRRPRMPFDVDSMLDFCCSTAGQSYDWWGLLRFFAIGAGKPDRMFCSEAITRAMRIAGPVLFDNRDADEVSPGMLDETRDLMDIWRS